MSYMNLGNNMDDFFKKHIEYGLSTRMNFDVYTKGITGLTSAYIIALKLFNKIKTSDLENLISNPTRSNIERINRNIKPDTDGIRKFVQKNNTVESCIFLTMKGIEIIPVQSSELEDYISIYGEPFILIGNVKNQELCANRRS